MRDPRWRSFFSGARCNRSTNLHPYAHIMPRKPAPSTELAGGAGFSYEDTVVAYYLAALLHEERAAGQQGIVTSVAVQQAQFNPMDDVIVHFSLDDIDRVLSLQIKRHLRISAAPSNTDFREVMAAAVATGRRTEFRNAVDAYGFVVEHVAYQRLRSLNRLIQWAQSSPTSDSFARRFQEGGAAAKAEQSLRNELAPLIDTHSPDDERQFYAHFIALRLDGLTDGGIVRTEIINRLQPLIATNEDGQGLLLFDRLCRLAREGAASGREWTRSTLLAQLRGAVRLIVGPNYQSDIDALREFSTAGLADISDQIVGIRVDRPALETKIRKHLVRHRLVSLSGLPGSGKSAMLKRIASLDAARGPILFLKSDRLMGTSWLAFVTALGLNHRMVGDVLAEIGSAGAPILFIDGIDRIRPDQKAVVTDILRAIEANDQLGNWRVLASSRDQGLEAYRAWFPPSFYRNTGFADVSIPAFSDDEATTLAQQKPTLQKLLFGPARVREVARRPFFAAVLAQSLLGDPTTPGTEVDLISAWWARGGHNASNDALPPRQRALLDLAETGVGTLGKRILARKLNASTVPYIAELKADRLIHEEDGGASYSFTHDIFFEWVFFRYLIELGDDWTQGLIMAGEPPLLGRVVGLLARHAFSSSGKWSTGYRDLEGRTLRPQWRREWLTAPPFSPTFAQGEGEFRAFLAENDCALLEKLLVWFQAQHTIPSPAVLGNPTVAPAGVDPVSMADLLSWPSDFHSWGRLLDWLLAVGASRPARLWSLVVELFDVWQNAFAGLENARSGAIVQLCNDWLLELEGIRYADRARPRPARWSGLGDAEGSRLAAALRVIIARSASSYPEPALQLLGRAATNDAMRGEAYSELMVFAGMLADVSPQALVAVTEAELLRELPGDLVEREERERGEYLRRLADIRAIPEDERNAEQRRALDSTFFELGVRQPDSDDVAIHPYHPYYFPPSPAHEPFASLFRKESAAGVRLVHSLANHATKAWRQRQLLDRRRLGTPLPVGIEFPWGRQEFWGDGWVYGWFLGHGAPHALECALLSLSYWAFREVADGRPAGEVIGSVVRGTDCYGFLGLALRLALETQEVSEVTLPIVTCQRLWHHDIERVVYESTANFDPLGIGTLRRLSGAKAEAKVFLDSRRSRKRDVRELAMRFGLSEEEGLRRPFKDALERFPDELPYETEERRGDTRAVVSLKEHARQWTGLGDGRNYRAHATDGGRVLVSYESPMPLSATEETRLAKSTVVLDEYRVIAWATESLQANELADGMSLDDAITFARARDSATVLLQRMDAGAHSAQTTVSAVAAVAIRFGPDVGPACEWAWGVMDRVAAMSEPRNAFPGSKIPWHPSGHLFAALVHDRRSGRPRADSLGRLFGLTVHPVEDVAIAAFVGLYGDSTNHVRWVAGRLAVDLSVRHRMRVNAGGGRDETVDGAARQRSVARALERLEQVSALPLAEVPSAWVRTPRSGPRSRGSARASEWQEPDPFLDAHFAARLLRLWPVEEWCQSPVYRPTLGTALRQLVDWTAERLMPSWGREASAREAGGYSETGIIEWNRTLGDLLARATPFFETEFVRCEFLASFLKADKAGLPVLASFAHWTVTRQIFDAPTIPTNTLDLLGDCVELVVGHKVFDPGGYRAGEVGGQDLVQLIAALLFVSCEGEAPGAARFANGDWSEVSIVMPLVTRLVGATGWSAHVMEKFLTLCERVGRGYPLDAFAAQSNAVLDSVESTRGGWAGTTLPARTAAAVQRLADANYPLSRAQARELLKVLDALIELGDRRSVALEQAEAFRTVQVE